MHVPGRDKKTPEQHAAGARHLETLHQVAVTSRVRLQPCRCLDIIAKSILCCNACTTSTSSAGKKKQVCSTALLSLPIVYSLFQIRRQSCKDLRLWYEEVNERPARQHNMLSLCVGADINCQKAVAEKHTRPTTLLAVQWRRQATSSSLFVCCCLVPSPCLQLRPSRREKT